MAKKTETHEVLHVEYREAVASRDDRSNNDHQHAPLDLGPLLESHQPREVVILDATPGTDHVVRLVVYYVTHEDVEVEDDE